MIVGACSYYRDPGRVLGGAGESGVIYDAINDALNSFGLGGTSNSNVPAAYLNYLIFNDNMEYVSGGFVQTSTSGGESLTLNVPTISNSGYIYVYVSNESNRTNYVYFDDLTVVHKHSGVVQEDDYYPFGLRQGKQLAFREDNRNLYNAGSELNSSSGLYETFYRHYDPALGRFNGVDIKAHKYHFATPYHYALNNPISFNDPWGDEMTNPGFNDDVWQAIEKAWNATPENGNGYFEFSNGSLEGFSIASEMSITSPLTQGGSHKGKPWSGVEAIYKALESTSAEFADFAQAYFNETGDVLLRESTIEEARTNKNFLNERIDEFYSALNQTNYYKGGEDFSKFAVLEPIIIANSGIFGAVLSSPGAQSTDGARVSKLFGRLLGVALVGYSTYEAVENQSIGNGVDAFFGVLSLIPATSVVGGVYFGADLLVFGITGQGFSEHIDGYMWLPISTTAGITFIPISKNP